MEIGARTRLLTLLGDPVEHSLSPALQNAAMRALGLDGIYVALRVPAARLGVILEALTVIRAAGNVTVPHKEAVERHLAKKTDVCVRTGACNTFWVEDDTLVGDNTDVAGVRAGIAAVGAEDARRWLVVGTGGTARAVAVAAGDAGAELLVRSRDPARAAAFVAWAGTVAASARAARDGDRADVVVNATPVGLRRSDPLPADPATIRDARAALDMVYGAGETPWVVAMRDAGCRAADGRVALVAQGAAAFARFHPNAGAAPVEVMRAAVEHALRR